MDRIQQCVRDVLYIANKTEDFGEAKKRIEQLFVVSKATETELDAFIEISTSVSVALVQRDYA